MARDEWTVEQAGQRLDKFLAAPERLGSRSRAASALERGKIFLNGHEAGLPDAARVLAAGDTVRIWVDRPGTAKAQPRLIADAELDVIHEDDQLVVINKPPGLLSVPLERKAAQPSVFSLLEDRFRSFGKRRPLVVHRIDQDTSGIVLFAKDPDAQRRLKVQFARHQPERVYLAVVHGHPDPPAGTWRDRIVWDDKAMIQKETHPRDPRGTDASAHYFTAERLAAAALIEVRLVTGRRNQIRLQARLRGHTLVGEERYTFAADERREIPFGRQALHAWRLTIVHPATGHEVTFEAPLPADFEELLARLRRKPANSPRPRPV
jgi:23S rRNA pseudouridine1911/1915/1917 synthase